MINKESLKEDLDEMQIQTRNKIGNQCYFILFPSLLIDIFLGNCGVKWAASSISISAIILICAIYYGIRVVGAGAYSTYSKKKLSFSVGFCVMLIAMGLIIKSFFKGSFSISYSGALRLFIFFVLFILIIVISSIVSRRKNNEGND
ncbi:hypothetical protein LGK95_21410 [Clostridium algoriphilum]|uniref:DUF6773 family protein n=1 Tax=Clostridium algoriphilum TaxID=198347 RepID=UPI001CF1D271|nr:DUF6773 family protein [Clostridium algoriphilum]MCB2296013.1 hypothetical protein [Clostridium algoriphilum]